MVELQGVRAHAHGGAWARNHLTRKMYALVHAPRAEAWTCAAEAWMVCLRTCCEIMRSTSAEQLREKMEQLEAQNTRAREAQEHARQRQEQLTAQNRRTFEMYQAEMTETAQAEALERMRLAAEQSEAESRAAEAQKACRAKELDVKLLRDQLKEKEEMMDAVLQQAQAAQQGGKEASRAEKQLLANTLKEEFDEERKGLLRKLHEKEEEAEEARANELLFSSTAADNHGMKTALNKIEQALMQKYNHSSDFLHLKMAPPRRGMVPKPLPESQQPDFYVREFGVVQQHEAVYELGLAHVDEMWMNWTAFDAGDSASELFDQAVRDQKGVIIGFLEQVRWADAGVGGGGGGGGGGGALA